MGPRVNRRYHSSWEARRALSTSEAPRQAQVAEEDAGRIGAARPVYASARVGRSASQIETPNGSAVPEPAGHRTEDELLVDREAAARDVAVDQIGVRRVEVERRAR